MLRSDFFFVHEITFICVKCQAKGVTDTCKHNKDFVPPWGGANKDLVALIMEGNDETYQRETMGVVNDEGLNCFSRISVSRMFRAPHINLTDAVRFVFVAIDPMGGCDNPDNRSSDFAVVSICSPYTTIVGLEMIDVLRSSDFQGKLLKHLDELRKKPLFSDAIFFVDVEAGTGLSAPDIEDLILNNTDRVVFMKDFHRKSGTKTDGAAKLDMMEAARRALDINDVHFMRNFVTSHPKPTEMNMEFEAQMNSYERVVCAATSIKTTSTVHLTGKNKGRKRDDMAMTFQRAVRMRDRILNLVEYRKYLL